MVLEGVDALITNVPGACIGVSTADCIPIILYDAEHRATAAIHAGWRGTVKRIAQKHHRTDAHSFLAPTHNRCAPSLGLAFRCTTLKWQRGVRGLCQCRFPYARDCATARKMAYQPAPLQPNATARGWCESREHTCNGHLYIRPLQRFLFSPKARHQLWPHIYGRYHQLNRA